MKQSLPIGLYLMQGYRKSCCVRAVLLFLLVTLKKSAATEPQGKGPIHLQEARNVTANATAKIRAQAGGMLDWVVGDGGVVDEAAKFLELGVEQGFDAAAGKARGDERTREKITQYARQRNRTVEVEKGTKEGYVDSILRKMDDEDADKGSGRFNKTMDKQEGVLETVARVGKQGRRVGNSTTAPQSEVAGDGKDNVDSAKGQSSKGNQGSEAKKAGWFGKEEKVSPETKGPSEGELKEQAAAEEERKHEEKDAKKREEEAQQGSDDGKEDVARLIDSQDNEYVITNPGKGLNQMQLQQDLILISDIVKVIVAAAIGGLICGLLGQPVILGYIVAGMVVGPGGFGLIHELVQVETLAQFGVVFLLFALGVEFSPSKMHGVHFVALGGGALEIGVAMLLGGLLGASVSQGVFVGAFLSMSSTTVVIKLLMDSNSAGTEPGQIMLGTLILQDCALGLLLAVMPVLAAKGNSPLAIAGALGKECLLLLVFCSLAWLASRVAVPRLMKLLSQLALQNHELYQLGVVAVCLCVALCSEFVGLSIEVGAFIAGLMLSGSSFSERTLEQVEPVRNLFAALFLASVGMVMHPYFLWQHIDVLLLATVVVLFGKALLITLVVRLFRYDWATAVNVGIALAQIGEFSFVLLSRAQVLNLVSKSLYLLLLGTTALSLVITPFAFRLVGHFLPLDARRTKQGGMPSPVVRSKVGVVVDRLGLSRGFVSPGRDVGNGREGSLEEGWDDEVETESIHKFLEEKPAGKEWVQVASSTAHRKNITFGESKRTR